MRRIRDMSRCLASCSLRAAALLLPSLLAAGCGIDTVHVDVTLGVCNEQTAFVSLRSADVVLKRNDNAKWVGGCSRALVEPSNIDEFVAMLSFAFSFRDVPIGGRWTLAVKGFSDDGCGQNAVILCGRTTDVPLPPPGGQITVAINCPPAYTELEEYKACIRE